MAETEKVEVDNRPTSQLDLEARLKNDFRPAVIDNTENDVLNPEKVVTPYRLEDNDTSGYLGVSPEYMNYANEAEKPITATEGPEAESLRRLQAGQPGVYKTQRPEAVTAEPGAQSVENLATATSGEDFSTKLVDRPTETGPTRVVLDEDSSKALEGQGTASSAPKATTPAPAPAKTAAPAAKRSNS